MSPTYEWLRAFHIFGVLMWMGTMIGLVHILGAHGRADLGSRAAFHDLERACARAMDIGATIAIAAGVALIVQVPSIMKHGYMHAKLALVVIGVLGAHGFLRVKVRKYRESNVVPLPGFFAPLLSLVGLAIIILVVVEPF